MTCERWNSIPRRHHLQFSSKYTKLVGAKKNKWKETERDWESGIVNVWKKKRDHKNIKLNWQDTIYDYKQQQVDNQVENEIDREKKKCKRI